MKCNIDRRGRRARWVGGALCFIAGVGMVTYSLAGRGDPLYPLLFTGLGTIAGGLFQFFEAAAGWCAIRAMTAAKPRP